MRRKNSKNFTALTQQLLLPLLAHLTAILQAKS
jgi:hypothetical protein